MNLLVLQNKESEEILRLLSAVSSSLLPNPRIDESVDHLKIETELIDSVINEIRQRLNIPDDDFSISAKSKIVDFISQEISKITLSSENIIQVRERLGSKGELTTTDEKILKEIYRAFEPNVPAASKYYVDCKDARGGGSLVKKIVRRLKSTKNENLRFLFTGHLGCGKSSELLYLKSQIEATTTFFPIYIDFENYLDLMDATLEDIFGGVFIEISSRCENVFGFTFLDNVESYPLLKEIRENIGKLRQNPNLRQQVRDSVKSNPKTSLLTELNRFIIEVELKLKQETSFTKLIIIADSLEKIKRLEKEESELISQKKLFVDHSEEMTRIATSVVYTVPLSLYRSSYGTRLQQLYSNNVFVLPMVKIHKRGKFDESFVIGKQDLIEIIKKRLNHANTTIEKVFDVDALEYLLTYCGGHIRSLLRFIQEASISVDELPINFLAARESVKGEVRSFAASVRESYWEKLANLELSSNQQINSDDNYSMMLESLDILEYIDDEELEAIDDVWYAVNPTIRLTIKFREALEKLKAEQNGVIL